DPTGAIREGDGPRTTREPEDPPAREHEPISGRRDRVHRPSSVPFAPSVPRVPVVRSAASSPRSPCLVLLLAMALVACSEKGPPAAAPGAATRVVSLAPSLTETLYALGAEDALLAVTSLCDRPPAAKEKPHVGDLTRLSLERIAGLEPDLVLVNSVTHLEMLAPLKERFRVEFVPTDDIGLVLDAILSIGDAVGKEEEAAALRGRLERELAERRAGAEDRAGTRRSEERRVGKE